jgi:SagB-type dehydrogenase family enzyme
VAAQPELVELLHALEDWTTAAALARRVGEPPAAVARALRTLERAALVTRAGREPSRERLLGLWRAWAPAAPLLHFSTRDLPYLDHAAGERALARKARAAPAPPAASRRGGRVRPLPPPRRDGVFPQVLLARRTWRRFSKAALAEQDLATLLWLTFGVQGWMDLGALGRAPLKTSPSGGARHPIEAYVLARRVEGVAPGLYRYDAVTHGLARIGRGGVSPARVLPRQPWFSGAAALVFLCAVFPRVLWRYENARAYRVVLAEAGHLAQTFCLVATWLGLAPFCTMALADTAIEKALGLDGVSESVLYATGVGRRPRGVVSAQAPPVSSRRGSR